MNITVVGSGTVVPRLERRQSCVVVRAGGQTLVFDLGSGAVRGMLGSGLDPLAVDRIFFTHFHPDHTVDVVPLLFAINYGAPEKRTLPLYLTGPEPFLRFWGSVMEVWGKWMAGDHATLVSELPHECPSPIDLPGAGSRGPRRSTAPRASPTGWMPKAERSCTRVTPSTAVRSRTGARRGYTPHRVFLPGRSPRSRPPDAFRRGTYRQRGRRTSCRPHPHLPCGGS